MTRTAEARNKAITEETREKIRLAANAAAIEGNGGITYSNLVAELDKEFKGSGTEVGQYEIQGDESSTQWTITAHTSAGDVVEVIKGVATPIDESETAVLDTGEDFNSKVKALADAAREAGLEF